MDGNLLTQIRKHCRGFNVKPEVVAAIIEYECSKAQSPNAFFDAVASKTRVSRHEMDSQIFSKFETIWSPIRFVPERWNGISKIRLNALHLPAKVLLCCDLGVFQRDAFSLVMGAEGVSRHPQIWIDYLAQYNNSVEGQLLSGVPVINNLHETAKAMRSKMKTAVYHLWRQKQSKQLKVVSEFPEVEIMRTYELAIAKQIAEQVMQSAI